MSDRAANAIAVSPVVAVELRTPYATGVGDPDRYTYGRWGIRHRYPAAHGLCPFRYARSARIAWLYVLRLAT